MLTWVLAAVAGLAIAVLLYGWRASREVPRRIGLVSLRGAAMALVLALVLDAPAGARRAPGPLVALDVSASWLRGGDTALWRRARAAVRAAGADSLLLFGDSVRSGRIPARPSDERTLARSLGERALGAGRPLVLVTDGELDDPDALPAFPAGSRIEVLAHRPARDLAIAALDAPRSAVSGDTVELRITLRVGDLPVPAGTLRVGAGGRPLATVPIPALPARAERLQAVRVPLAVPPGATSLTAVATVDGDAERRNDTLTVSLDVSRAAGAVLVSTSPDLDARFVLPVLRGAVALPTRAYFRVAPGAWREDGSLAPVSEEVVRGALREAPLAILHGDTSYFGPPRRAATGSLVLIAPPTDSTGEWYPVSAPPSPIAAAIAGIPWDSLPPLGVAGHPPAGDWEGLTVARARRFDRRPAIVGTATGRRVVVVGATGLWRWAFRGGVSADAFATLWGSIFDWLSAERPDPRAAVPAGGVIRSGERIRWRKGSGTDTVVVARLRRRGSAREDSVTLRFGSGVTMAESDPLPAGTYDVRIPGGAAVLAVNASAELLPRAPTVRAGSVGGSLALGDRPGLRDRGWAYLAVLAALCAEWLLRRRQGLR